MEGIPGKGAELSLKDIHQQVAARFLGLELPDGQIRPEPSTLVVDTAEQLAFARNHAVKPSAPPAPAPPPGTPLAHHTTRAAPTAVRIERRSPWPALIALTLGLCVMAVVGS
ncbi:hypothetical protein EV192_103326 [Actinocrispum wychmicini]|uniref:Uncharacterized protein n=1 Tax=Actinocrispum wychmicini TaxID=1213861 RepID=A0A4R2JL52_9PSEU|nr:hypothetical protein EV192_103326 [Actinocrispum wychmicini]